MGKVEHCVEQAVIYAGNGPLQAHSIKKCIQVVSGRPKRYAIKMVFKWFRAVQKGMLSKWCFDWHSLSGRLCPEHGIKMVTQ